MIEKDVAGELESAARAVGGAPLLAEGIKEKETFLIAYPSVM